MKTMASKQLKINRDPDYQIGDWDLRVQRMNTCYNCEHMELMQHGEERGEEYLYQRMVCEACSCVCWPLSSINKEDGCPYSKWEISNAKWRRMQEKDF
jgi:hypothetical protein